MAFNRRLPDLYVVASGQPQFRRFQVANKQKQLWTGERFGDRGLLFHKHHEAAYQLQEILKVSFTGVEPIRFEAPVVVEVYSHEEVDPFRMAGFLAKTYRHGVDTTEHFIDPRDALVLARIRWDQVRLK